MTTLKQGKILEITSSVTEGVFCPGRKTGLILLVFPAILSLLFFSWRPSQASQTIEDSSLTPLSLDEFEARLMRQAEVESEIIDAEINDESPLKNQNEVEVKKVQKIRTVTLLNSNKAPLNTSVTSPSPFHLLEKVEEIIGRHGRKGVDAHTLAKRIVSESAKQKFDPLFVAAVIKSESAFDKLAESGVGAKGLMQIMPATSKFIEKFDDFEPVMHGKLTDPNYNVRLGIRYLKHLDEIYKGNRVFVLAAYNWGPGRIQDAFVGKRSIPKDVMNYALKILGDHQKWRAEINREIT